MKSDIRISETIQKLFRCPICHAKLDNVGHEFICGNSDCDTHFPIMDGVPILLNEQSSVFVIDDFSSPDNSYFGNARESRLKSTIRRFIPTVGNNLKAKENYSKFADLLIKRSAQPRILVVGGSVLGQGMEALEGRTSLEFVNSDVSLSARTMLICDAHDIPFENESFDGVILQAVLEHVADPYRCVEEIHRVLKEQGIVYAETPFMQQVHGGRYDFTRFTHLGHRRLFRKFDEIDSGAVAGPGVALAWSYQYFLRSFTTSRILRPLIGLFSSLTSFYLKYFDYFLINKPHTLDCASGYYFMGSKAEKILSDRELIKLYRGTY